MAKICGFEPIVENASTEVWRCKELLSCWKSAEEYQQATPEERLEKERAYWEAQKGYWEALSKPGSDSTQINIPSPGYASENLTDYLRALQNAQQSEAPKDKK